MTDRGPGCSAAAPSGGSRRSAWPRPERVSPTWTPVRRRKSATKQEPKRATRWPADASPPRAAPGRPVARRCSRVLILPHFPRRTATRSVEKCSRTISEDFLGKP
ncbi:hypothetical protein QR78_02555 [Methylobacterium indicum]|uniref:Uncharacterized protein n=1 Tax=Methylobacterium indicum TaxID=1775910 RepID=A0ABR5HHZ5_9HYPH|nr:hypothetical protein QR78_02555 [Methylobacterium indicum]KMO26316.1 hypothetical protein QR79_02930 [Methylobacterium indicum]